MIQGGGFSADMGEKNSNDPIENEADNAIKNAKGTIAMARTNDPNSATSQFYINLRMNSSLDRGRGKEGYAVFGKVIEGQYVVSDISKREIAGKGRFSGLPLETVIINSVDVKE